ncbi:SRR1 family protein [Aspergillus ibericus CBS 121593]|uniref:SRR1-like domain-containing protein n=1 Tax=Aspergillus ibericus CBS 121593 TaxID=1448316 RepID=A0A395GUJ0_9EURO|nr:hypothetical protein BO80DRAFT_446948 [Aspergillus ibericus CBS 121593]RAK98844.1 hypothetical protein BO80DRAFT_446948 [Aspergillus ibericus CBS 121593]
MPHSSRKKPSRSQTTAQKRLEITDAAGWTHVTTSGNARRCVRTTTDSTHPQDIPSHLTPAEAPPKLTLDDLHTQFQQSLRVWKESPTWSVVEKTLLQQTVQHPGSQPDNEIDSIICIGLGSLSGFLRGGWVDRRTVSLYQLAALVSVVDCLKTTTQQTHPIKTYAQDPVFNELDKSLLASLDITVLETPLAFEKISSRTFLFCPGAERAHLEQVLAVNPSFVFGGPLEDVESQEVSRFVASRGSVRLPQFEEQEHAFWNMRVYYPQEERD